PATGATSERRAGISVERRAASTALPMLLTPSFRYTPDECLLTACVVMPSSLATCLTGAPVDRSISTSSSRGVRARCCRSSEIATSPRKRSVGASLLRCRKDEREDLTKAALPSYLGKDAYDRVPP